jgi:hypothetical protein
MPSELRTRLKGEIKLPGVQKVNKSPRVEKTLQIFCLRFCFVLLFIDYKEIIQDHKNTSEKIL